VHLGTLPSGHFGKKCRTLPLLARGQGVVLWNGEGHGWRERKRKRKRKRDKVGEREKQRV